MMHDGISGPTFSIELEALRRLAGHDFAELVRRAEANPDGWNVLAASMEAAQVPVTRFVALWQIAAENLQAVSLELERRAHGDRRN